MKRRQEIVRYCTLLSDKGFVAANDGNISVVLDEETLLITPAGIRKGEVIEEMLVSVRFGQTEKDAPCFTCTAKDDSRPSSEVLMHHACYRSRSDITAVIHAHPPFATALAATEHAEAVGEDILLPEILLTTGIPGVVSYHTPGSVALAQAVGEAVAQHNGLLLKNHGVLIVGEDLSQAYARLESIEMYCKVRFLATLLGNTTPLSNEEAAHILRATSLLSEPSPETGLL